MLCYRRNAFLLQIPFFFFMKIKSMFNLHNKNKICAMKKISCANEKKSAPMNMLMAVLGFLGDLENVRDLETC